jgi:hypothetical protein
MFNNTFNHRYLRGGTFLGRALRLAKNRLFASSSPSRKKTLIVLTDGLAIDNILTPIQQLVAMKVDVFAVGVGTAFSRQQLLTIAKDPQHVYDSSFKNLDSLIARLTRKTCYGKSDYFYLYFKSIISIIFLTNSLKYDIGIRVL